MMLLGLRSMKNSRMQKNFKIKATNTILQGLPPEVYSLVNHHQVAKEILDRVKLLMQGTELSYQERECELYYDFDRFSSVKGESLHEYYLGFAQLMNDMHIIGMTMQQVQVNTKFLNTLPPEWSLDVPSFLPGDDLIACLNKAMAFMSTVMAPELVLDEEQLVFLADLGVANGQATQTIITHNTAFQTDDLDAYNSDCDDISSAKGVGQSF
ncbi:hypothetical protein Tco_0738874 [Tanacetum coccineum]